MRLRHDRLLVGSSLAGAVLAVLMSRAGWPALLDWAPGPHWPLPRALYGLDGGVQDSMPAKLALWVVAQIPVVGAWSAAALPLAIWVPVAATGARRLARAVLPDATGRASSLLALLVVLNPFTVDRLAAGQVFVLLGYAALVHLLARLLRAPAPTAAELAVALTLLAALSPHMAVAGALSAVVSLARTRLVLLSALLWAVALNSYLWIPPALLGTAGSGGHVTLADFALDGWAGLPAPMAAAVGAGFWGSGGDSVTLAARLVWFGAVAAAVVGGAVVARRRRAALLGWYLAGTVAALATWAPVRPVAETAVQALPALALLREPGKLLALTVIVVGVLLMLCLNELPRAMVLLLAAGLLAPTAWTAVTVVDARPGAAFDVAWSQADRQMRTHDSRCPQQGSPGAVLVLPFQHYVATHGTNGRVTAQRAPFVFDRRVVVANDPGLRQAGPIVHDRLETAVRAALLERAATANDVPLRHLLQNAGICYVLSVAPERSAALGLDRDASLRALHSVSGIDLYQVRATTQVQVRSDRPGSYRITSEQTGGAPVAIAETYDTNWAASGGTVWSCTSGAVCTDADRLQHRGTSVVAAGWALSTAAGAVLGLWCALRRRARAARDIGR